MIYLSQRNLLKKRLPKRALSKSIKTRENNESNFNEKKEEQKKETAKLIREGLRESLIIVLKTDGIIKGSFTSKLTPIIVKKNLHKIVCVGLKKKKNSVVIPQGTFRNFQSLFSSKIQSNVIGFLVTKGPFKYLQHYASDISNYIKTIKKKPLSDMTNNLWDMFAFVKETTKEIKKKKQRKNLKVIIEREKQRENIKKKRIRGTDKRRKTLANHPRVFKGDIVN